MCKKIKIHEYSFVNEAAQEGTKFRAIKTSYVNL